MADWAQDRDGADRPWFLGPVEHIESGPSPIGQIGPGSWVLQGIGPGPWTLYGIYKAVPTSVSTQSPLLVQSRAC